MGMREILFRGKTKDGFWVEGFYTKGFRYPDEGELINMIYTFLVNLNIQIPSFNAFEVIPETVGQFTGLIDKNGKKIFEGDILQPPCWHTKCNLNCVCIYAEEHTTASIQGFALYHKINDCVELVQSDEWDEFKVIGNIHDNPELLEQK